MHEDVLYIEVQEGEYWWGPLVRDSLANTHDDVEMEADLALDARNSQSAPLLLSSHGRYIWSDKPFRVTRSPNAIQIFGGEPQLVVAGENTLRGAYLSVSDSYFPASGLSPAAQHLLQPQYCTWMEMPWKPTQAKVIDYAHRLIESGFPPGLLIIDDRWSTDYGDWTFDRDAFPDPRTMISQLVELGFSVVLWLAPFVSPDSPNFRYLAENQLLVREPSGEPVIRRWWNGWSAILDASHPGAVDWLETKLRDLEALGVTGFKFDAGDPHFYRSTDVAHSSSLPIEHCEWWGRLGLRFAYAEYRALWKLGNSGMVQRLHDKPLQWDGEDGLLALIPEIITLGLIGHPFSCPDMVGGGMIETFGEIDEELFVRFAQCSALMPAVQFSLLPSRYLDDAHLLACLDALKLRERFQDYLSAQFATAAAVGTPVIRPLAYLHRGYEHVHDQYLVGDDLLVAPVLERGATVRRLVLPPGRWRDLGGKEWPAGTHLLDVTLGSLPVFCRVDGSEAVERPRAAPNEWGS